MGTTTGKYGEMSDQLDSHDTLYLGDGLTKMGNWGHAGGRAVVSTGRSVGRGSDYATDEVRLLPDPHLIAARTLKHILGVTRPKTEQASVGEQAHKVSDAKGALPISPIRQLIEGVY